MTKSYPKVHVYPHPDIPRVQTLRYILHVSLWYNMYDGTKLNLRC